MKRTIQILVMLAILFSMTGCASMYSMHLSKQEIAEERIMASGNEEAMSALRMGVPPQRVIKAVPIGNNGAGIGIDIGNMEALSKHPVRQSILAVVDAASIIAVGMTADHYLNDDDSSSSSQTERANANGTGDISVNVEGSDDIQVNIEIDIENDTETHNNTDSGDGNYR